MGRTSASTSNSLSNTINTHFHELNGIDDGDGKVNSNDSQGLKEATKEKGKGVEGREKENSNTRMVVGVGDVKEASEKEVDASQGKTVEKSKEEVKYMLFWIGLSRWTWN
ncbi:hypothetical protein PM082_020812 [Marasmius tenuissimus]|nr:hypothetical protein PM082_020812 [Marasmius tenuissimus]